MSRENWPVIPNYRLEERLEDDTIEGIGLFRATSKEKGGSALLKIFSLNAVSGWAGLEGLENEAKILKELSHPALPYFRWKYTEDKYVAFAYEYERARRLADYTKRFTRKQIEKIAEELLWILHYIQDQPRPIVHRDIVPENILFRESSDRVSLVNFKRARRIGEREADRILESGAHSVFHAPERYRPDRLTLSQDLYSVGMVIIQLLTGRSESELEKLPRKLNKLDAIPKEWVVWLQKMIDKNPAKRYADAREALEAFREANSGEAARKAAEASFVNRLKRFFGTRRDPLARFATEIVNRARRERRPRRVDYSGESRPVGRKATRAAWILGGLALVTNPSHEWYIDRAAREFMTRSPTSERKYSLEVLKLTLDKPKLSERTNFLLFGLYRSRYPGIGEIRSIGAFGNFWTYSFTSERPREKK
jgi:serine/threonine protein kinase